MKIVHVASECYPFVKTGGLADAVGSLASTLAQKGHEVSLFLPGYRSALDNPLCAGSENVLKLRVEMGDQFYSGELKRLRLAPGLTLYLVCRDEWFDRRGLYGNGERDYDDNFHRFIFFQKAVIEALRLLDLKADIVHCHDWQAGLLPLLLRVTEQRLDETLTLATVFTVHNIAFQGLFPMRSYYRTNLPSEFRGIDGVEFYGQISMLKGGLLYADRITTVSPNYAAEIQGPAFGCGLEGVVSMRADALRGLLNGMDTRVWNPSTDPMLPAHYSVEDLSGKALCREALLAAAGMKAGPEVPVYGMVCRMTEQKGIDLLLSNRDFFLKEDVRLVALGTGDRRLMDGMRSLAASSKGKVWLADRLDEGLSHLIEAGSDFFLMPSLFEPCGLNQMYSQAYGTIPLVSSVGGLKDTVIDVDEDPARGTGLCFDPHTLPFRMALTRSLRLFADRPRLAATQARGMKRDFSWATAAKAYEMLYRELV